MIITNYPAASKDEIEALKKLVRKSTPRPQSFPTSSPGPAPAPIKENPAQQSRHELRNKIKLAEEDVGPLFKGGIANLRPSRDALQIDNPVQWLLALRPDFRPYKWQFESLMQIAGYLDIGNYTPEAKSKIDDKNPLLAIYACANGSGKDMVLIAAAATWFVVSGARNRVIITSSSFEQTKFQTEPAIRDLILLANKKFGTLFKSTQFHHIVPELGSEIKLFATDEAAKAEGFHPFDGGGMMIIINEAKSVTEQISDALSRCTGYTHRLEISSPGPRSGFMFKHASNAINYPSKPELGRYYYRRVTAFDCPHISPAHIENMAHEKGIDSPWYKSSILAEFSDVDATVVVSDYEYTQCLLNPPPHRDADIGIGLDLAAGGDEDACFVRQGNKVIHSFFFRNHDTELAVDIIDKQLAPWRNEHYTFRVDNGGIGMPMIDKLRKLGWNVVRTNNQSPSSNKREFLNLGAEMWFYLKRLIARRDIILPNVAKLQHQLTTRWYRGFDSTQGKLALESKAEARLSGRPSPDRADALVLCFYSYHPTDSEQQPKKKDREERNFVDVKELLKLEQSGRLWATLKSPIKGRFTQMSEKL